MIYCQNNLVVVDVNLSRDASLELDVTRFISKLLLSQAKPAFGLLSHIYATSTKAGNCILAYPR